MKNIHDWIRKEISLRRSFAIIAHPDAGKTTLTEKLLLYGGAIHLAGHVRARKKHRSTRSDWMKMEQERGISVTSAAMQFSYRDYKINLLDTPGHQDFSEDTYRTLMAADAAIMLLDAARGVETQTIKLFEVCKDKGIPIVTFINKMDLPAMDALDLLDNIEKVLGITAAPMYWPIGSGRDFHGVIDLRKGQLHLYDIQKQAQALKKEHTPSGPILDALDSPILRDRLEPDMHTRLSEELMMAQELLPRFDNELFEKGQLTPVFFGSAVKNFGIELFLDAFIELCPSPSPLSMKSKSPYAFSGFIFKLQANMDKKHRDRIAFLRICSGMFERGMEAVHTRSQKTIRLNNPIAFFGQERSTVDRAFAGDIIGLSNPGVFAIGDGLCSHPDMELPTVPKFAPECFAYITVADTRKFKAFRKGLQDLSEEGVIQVFRSDDGRFILGVVGQLQLETFSYRLQDEYGVESNLESMPYECSRWYKADSAPDVFSSYDKLVKDKNGDSVVLFRSQHRQRAFQNSHPDFVLHAHGLN